MTADLTPERLAELQEVTEAASDPGHEWAECDDPKAPDQGHYICWDGKEDYLVATVPNWEEAAFVAAWNPETAKALLDLLAKKDAIIASYEHRINWHTTCENCANLLDQLYEQDKEIDRLRGVAAERDQAVVNMNDALDNDGLATAYGENVFRTSLERLTREHKTNIDRVNPSKKSRP